MEFYQEAGLREVAMDGAASALWDLYRNSELTDVPLGQLTWSELETLTKVAPLTSYAAAMSESGIILRRYFLGLAESVTRPYPTDSA